METKVYPSCCSSAFCGKTDCKGCKNKPVLDAFKAWVKDTDAVVADKIWSPNIYKARKCT